MIDVAVSGALLTILSPLILAIAIVIKVESHGPAFFRAQRVGRHGRPIGVLKFRKMTHGAAGQALTGDHDDRFTRIGRFLARTKLDEIPQLWNVFLGQMSLVGPRPEDEEFIRLHAADYRVILDVRPGITGLNQLAFAREAEILDPEDRIGHYVDRILPQKVKLDTLYATGYTMLGDLRIMIWSLLPVVLRVDVAVNRDTGDLTVRRRKAAPKKQS